MIGESGTAAKQPPTGRARPRAVAIGIALTLATSACGEPTSDSSPQETATSTSTPEEPMTSTSSPSGLPAAAVADLSRRLGIDAQDVSVVVDEEVTWRNSSLGCPEPGRIYGQGLVDGRRLVLEAEGREYAYHSDGTKDPFLCEDPESPASTRDGDTGSGEGNEG